MLWNMKQNLEQLHSETHSKERGPDNVRMARCRERDARAEIARLRAFAARKPGRVADNCNAIADEIEAKLQEALDG